MKRGIKILLFADAWMTFALGMIGPIYAIFVERIGGDLLDASWAYFTFMLTSGVVMYSISRWENHVKHKEKLVVAGYLIGAFGALLYYFVDGQSMLLITQVVLGFSVAILSPAFDAVYSHYVNKKKEASDWGAWESMGYLVTAIAALAGGYIADIYGFKTLFIVMFISSICGAIISFRLFKNKKSLSKG